MSDKDNGSKVTLSRRKALSGLSTIGAVGALGVGSTYAQFTDTEEKSVTFTAGGIDGDISWSGSYNGNEVSEDLINVTTGDEGVNGSFHFTDIKPGDYGCVNFGITVNDNPAWVASCLDYSNNIDHEDYDGEDDRYGDDQDESETPGELAENLLTIPYYDSDGTCTFFDSGGPPEKLPDDFSVPSHFWSNSSPGGHNGLAPRTVYDVANNDGAKNTMEWNGGAPIHIEAPDGATVGNGCVLLDGGQAGGPSGDNTRGVSGLKPGDELFFGYDFHLPFDTGNEVQGDRMELKFGFNFLQKRHTEAPEFGSYSPGDNTPN